MYASISQVFMTVSLYPAIDMASFHTRVRSPQMSCITCINDVNDVHVCVLSCIHCIVRYSKLVINMVVMCS